MRKGIAAAGCAAFVVTTAAACGTTASLSSGAKVQQALDRLGEQKSVTLSVGFDGNQQQIWTALKGTEDFTQDYAKLLADFDVSMSLSADKPLKDVKDTKTDPASVALRVSLGQGKDLLEVRSLAGKQVYLRADLHEFLTLADGLATKEDKADLQEFRQMLDAADKLPSSLKSVKDAVGGKWVSVDVKSFEEFSKTMAKEGGSPLPDTSALDPKTAEQVTKALREAVEHNAKFTDAGSKDGADHVKVTLPAGKTADALAEALKPVADQLPDGFSTADLQSVPDKDVSVDVAVKDGALSGITLDLDQFDTGNEIQGALPLTVGFAPDAQPVAAPAGATPLNPQDIMGAVMQLMAGGMAA
ncbi:hypothetical protein ABZ883_07330 [Streptomyces sp. NPDC046977]|uniref:hypothetical protein n=1 Tax=Streptomyces sp. NPDC046977 TaxID=3154703 RepID=UPI0033E70FB5